MYLRRFKIEKGLVDCKGVGRRFTNYAQGIVKTICKEGQPKICWSGKRRGSPRRGKSQRTGGESDESDRESQARYKSMKSAASEHGLRVRSGNRRGMNQEAHSDRLAGEPIGNSAHSQRWTQMRQRSTCTKVTNKIDAWDEVAGLSLCVHNSKRQAAGSKIGAFNFVAWELNDQRAAEHQGQVCNLCGGLCAKGEGAQWNSERFLTIAQGPGPSLLKHVAETNHSITPFTLSQEILMGTKHTKSIISFTREGNDQIETIFYLNIFASLQSIVFGTEHI